MWKTPDRDTLINLILDGLSNNDLAEYYDCTLELITDYLTEFRIINNVEQSVTTRWIVVGVNTHKKPKTTRKIRKCLCCLIGFDSENLGNRICPTCKRKESPHD